MTPKQTRFVGYYVYALSDPTDGGVFYVGKGTGSRCYQHERQARAGTSHNQALAVRILALLRRGVRPTVTCLADGLTESQAIDRERQEIYQANGLCNVAPGMRSFEERQRLRAKALIQRFKSIREVHDPEARTWHRRCLKALAHLVACPHPEWLVSGERLKS
jgi:hypothetical protein